MPHVNRGDTLSFKCDDGYFDLVVTGVRIFEGKGIKYVYLKPPFLRNKLFKGLVLQDTVPIGWNVY